MATTYSISIPQANYDGPGLASALTGLLGSTAPRAWTGCLTTLWPSTPCGRDRRVREDEAMTLLTVWADDRPETPLVQTADRAAIAEHLGISENTVKNHVRSILEKLPAKTRAEAAIVGLKRGLTTALDCAGTASSSSCRSRTT